MSALNKIPEEKRASKITNDLSIHVEAESESASEYIIQELILA